MDLGSIFLTLALAILVGLFVSQPLLNRKSPVSKWAEPAGEHERSMLLAEKDRILQALKELDFDHTLGKIPEEDYPQQRAALVKHGADILRRLDEVHPELSTTDAEAHLEAALAARRRELSASSSEVAPSGIVHERISVARSRGVSATVGEADDDLEVLIAQRRRIRQDKSAGFCPKCGSAVQKSDRFCPKCGMKLS